MFHKLTLAPALLVDYLDKLAKLRSAGAYQSHFAKYGSKTRTSAFVAVALCSVVDADAARFEFLPEPPPPPCWCVSFCGFVSLDYAVRAYSASCVSYIWTLPSLAIAFCRPSSARSGRRDIAHVFKNSRQARFRLPLERHINNTLLASSAGILPDRLPLPPRQSPASLVLKTDDMAYSSSFLARLRARSRSLKLQPAATGPMDLSEFYTNKGRV